MPADAATPAWGRAVTAPAPRPSNRATVIAQAIVEHPAYPWGALVMGLALMGFGGWLIYKTPPVALSDKIFDGLFLLTGLCILPSMPSRIADGAKQIGAAAGPYLPWGKKDDPPPGPT